jgi:mannose-1-phosphate guanylyltransferase
MKNRYVVIMAGGRGERFWPQSRLKKPKHLLPIVGELADACSNRRPVKRIGSCGAGLCHYQYRAKGCGA